MQFKFNFKKKYLFKEMDSSQHCFILGALSVHPIFTEGTYSGRQHEGSARPIAAKLCSPLPLFLWISKCFPHFLGMGSKIHLYS